MIKYLFSTGLLALVLLPITGYAAYDDVSIGTDAVFSVSSQNISVTGSAVVVESATVNDGTIVFTMPASSKLTLQSSSRYYIYYNATPEYVTGSCTDSAYTLTITMPSTAATETVTITPSTSLCASQTSTAVVGRSSGSASPSVVTPVSSPSPTPSKTPVAQKQPTTNLVFLTDLGRGDKNDDVSRLQALLAQDKSIYPEGIVSGLFGPATERAVKQFQKKYGLPQVGKVGPMTRAKLGEIYMGTPVVPATPTVTPKTSFNRTLSKGISGADVKALQVILNADPDTKIAGTGTGSAGKETEMYGSLTEDAVGRFQVKYGIASPGDTGYGVVGPKTRVKLNELAK